ncbi:MAG: microviridin/marinostatin family tricyclic proteinase inhibitor [Nostoc sp. ChiSLP02]|nr:microviridin/marinostatin family tricyclic proteinase inhibitor [Nostoc sp. DedSLP05]MDZ8101014.1 microviridin/marinostatin family tricyclic proteinase inhibitor [Nostoc sp. DedSLP01]MDZ8188468.1 microviridin/marinostatin family tricyclic proteinase inhibitor [Nostoc sp. ChiSLP02]
MSANKPEEANSQAVPFFARFLEGQGIEDLSEEESEDISGGTSVSDIKCIVTNKKTDQPIQTHKKADQPVQTLKYPSDREDVVATKKYPSDNDEQFVTLKYPSDNEDGGTAVS